MEKIILKPIQEIPISIQKNKIFYGKCTIFSSYFFMRDFNYPDPYMGCIFYSKCVKYYDQNNNLLKNFPKHWIVYYDNYIQNNSIIFQIENIEEYWIFSITDKSN